MNSFAPKPNHMTIDGIGRDFTWDNIAKSPDSADIVNRLDQSPFIKKRRTNWLSLWHRVPSIKLTWNRLFKIIQK